MRRIIFNSSYVVRARSAAMSTVVGFVSLASAVCANANQSQPRELSAEKIVRELAFSDVIYDRELTMECDFWDSSGRSAFDTGIGQSEPQRVGHYEVVGIVRRDGSLCQWARKTGVQGHKPLFMKVMAFGDRRCKLKYLGDDPKSGIDVFIEEPRKFGIEIDSGIIDHGLWFGYPLAERAPRFVDVASSAKWTSDGPNRAVTTVDHWSYSLTFDETPANHIEALEIRDTNRSKTSPVYSLREMKVRYLEWKPIDGVDCPRRAELRYLYLTQEGSLLTQVSNLTLKSVSSRRTVSDGYAKFIPEVPNGTRVEVGDAPGIEYVWEYGKIVRRSDAVKVKSYLGRLFYRSPVRGYTLVFFAVLAAAVTGLFLWRRWKS